MNLRERVKEASEALRTKMPFEPQVAVVLGSGLGGFVEDLQVAHRVNVKEIPHYPVPSVPGHAGELLWAQVGRTRALILRGRVHLYEGYSPQEVVFPVHVAASLGAKCLVVTNAAGGVHPDFQPGDLMLIRDHVNFMFRNPLVGPHDEQFGPRFPDMSHAYSPRLLELARSAASELGIRLREGILFGLLGPTYETPAEVRMVRTLGGDAVTMSTIPEVIAARQWGLEVLGISVITNKASAHEHGSIHHDEVIQVADRVGRDFGRLLRRILEKLAEL